MGRLSPFLLAFLLVGAVVASAQMNISDAGTPRRRQAIAAGSASGGCNLYAGRWVLDNATRPAYDNKNCPYFDELTSTLNCFKDPNRKPDWMMWSWKPNNCGGTARFNAKQFLTKMKGKTIFIAGDSLCDMAFFPSLVCQIHQVSPMKKTAKDPDFGGAMSFTDATYGVRIAYTWSSFLVAQSDQPKVVQQFVGEAPGRGDAILNIDRPDPAWAPYMKNADMLLFESAIHWPFVPHIHAYRRWFFSQRWQAIFPQPDVRTAFKHAMGTVAKTVAGSKAIPYFLSVPPRLGGCQGQMAPLTMQQAQALVTTNSESTIWFPIQNSVFGTAPYHPWALVDLTHPSLYRGDALMGSQGGSKDCLHPCMPGLPDIWVDLFYEVWRRDPRFQ